ncbi:MAG TPA: cation transporter [Bryobacteraceae bacterium]|nr:cation transporter [Bryobacteraceae bacterium]
MKVLVATALSDRQSAVRRGELLEYGTIAWNSAEGVIAVLVGLLAGSVALVGFGLDSFIEVSSGVALLWRLHHDRNEQRRERVERLTLRIVGWCFLALAAYVGQDSLTALLRREAPDESLTGIVLAAVSLIVMPLLARAKRRVAAQLGSAAMAADARQTDFCMYLSAILLAGLGLNALFGWWWADPSAGLLMTPIIVNEGVRALRGKTCCCAGPH